MTEPWHGTSGGYTNHGCRQECCRKAWREYRKERGYQKRYRDRLIAAGLSTAGTFTVRIPRRGA